MAVVLITGCSSGFGKLAATEFAAVGHTVVATMRGSNSKNKSAAESLRETGIPHVLEMDVADEQSVNDSAKLALSLVGHVDVIVEREARMIDA